MLNPPLSLLSDDLLASIVEQLAMFPFLNGDLQNLSLADRAFTESCQKYIFRQLRLGTKKISKQLTRVKYFLDDKPSFANRVRAIELFPESREESALLFNDPNFTGILQLLARSPMPPHDLHFNGSLMFPETVVKDPLLVMRQLTESFFSQTLTILRLTEIANIPLPLFLICPRLREVILDNVGATDKSYHNYPNNLCSDREAPLLEVLQYRHSHTLVEQMISPPPTRFNTHSVILWSNLRVLILAPDDKEGMDCLQPILDAACNTLEELYLTLMRTYTGEFKQLSLAGLVNLSKLLNLHAFCLSATVDYQKRRKAPRKIPVAVLRDINIVLGTIPESNTVTNLSIDIYAINVRGNGLNQDWDGMFHEIIRIGGGKPLELDLELSASMGTLEDEHPEQNELYISVMEKTALLSDHPNICTHWWNPNTSSPSFRNRYLGPLFCRRQVRRRCRR